MEHVVLAYIDPGSGSIAIQAIMGAVLGVSYAFRSHVATVVRKVTGKDKNTEAQ